MYDPSIFQWVDVSLFSAPHHRSRSIRVLPVLQNCKTLPERGFTTGKKFVAKTAEEAQCNAVYGHRCMVANIGGFDCQLAITPAFCGACEQCKLGHYLSPKSGYVSPIVQVHDVFHRCFCETGDGLKLRQGAMNSEESHSLCCLLKPFKDELPFLVLLCEMSLRAEIPEISTEPAVVYATPLL